jgi:hypothetical protein
VQPKQGNAGCVISIVALVFVVLAGVGAAFFVFAARSSAGVSASEPSREKTPDRSRPTPARAPAPPPPPSVDYFQSAESVGTAIAARFTPNAELRELVLYTGYAIFELRDPAKRENVDRYVLRPSGYDEPRPVTVSGRDKSQLDAATFRLSEVRFALVPQLVADAKIRIPVADGQVSHIIIDKFFPFRKALGFRVYIRSEREGGGYVSYDAAGKMLKVQK